MTAKEKLVRAIEELPDDATIEDAMGVCSFWLRLREAFSRLIVGKRSPMPR